MYNDENNKNKVKNGKGVSKLLTGKVCHSGSWRSVKTHNHNEKFKVNSIVHI